MAYIYKMGQIVADWGKMEHCREYNGKKNYNKQHIMLHNVYCNNIIVERRVI